MDTTQTAELLQSLIGTWEGENNTWFEPNVIHDTSPIRATIRALPGGDFIVYEYDSSLEGKPFHGIAIIAFNTNTQRFEMAWMDTFHMGTNIMMSSGDPRDGVIAVTGSYSVGDSPVWGWRTEFRRPDADHLIVTSYNIIPDEPEAKALEATYQRSSVPA